MFCSSIAGLVAWVIAKLPCSVVLAPERSDQNCPIFGIEEENGFHAVIRCTKAKASRLKMRYQWQLPSEAALAYSGKDWLLILLDALSSEEKSHLLLLLWQWHLRNDIIHAQGKKPAGGSCATKRMENADTSWEKPDQRWDKIEVGGSFDSGSGDASVGIVIRTILFEDNQFGVYSRGGRIVGLQGGIGAGSQVGSYALGVGIRLYFCAQYASCKEC